jgi:photosynthetic reaction center H subunit
MVRYYEAEIPTAGGARRVLVPVNFCRVNGERGTVTVRALYAEHFAAVPALANPDVVTMLEEDKIVGYYGGGLLYAHPSRAEPLL